MGFMGDCAQIYAGYDPTKPPVLLIGTPKGTIMTDTTNSAPDTNAVRDFIGKGGLGHQPKSQGEVTALMKLDGAFQSAAASVRLGQDRTENPGRYQPAPSIGLDNVGGLQGKEKKAAKATTKPTSLSDWCDAIGATIVIKRQPKKGSKPASYTVYVEGLLHTLIYGNGATAGAARADLVQKLLARDKGMTITFTATDAKGGKEQVLGKELNIPRGLTV